MTADIPGYYTSLYLGSFTDSHPIAKPFYKTISERGNDLYIGELTSGEYISITEMYEHVKSQEEAVSVYNKIVASAIDDGYVKDNSFSSSKLQHRELYGWKGNVDAWYGKKEPYSLIVAYYYNPDVHSWAVEQTNIKWVVPNVDFNPFNYV